MRRKDRTEDEKKEYLNLLLQVEETPLGKESRKLQKGGRKCKRGYVSN